MTQSTRQANYDIHPSFTQRWSPRAFDDQPLAEEEILRLIEAARWAPSAFNVQPWRFCYAIKGDDYWDRFLDALIPFNQSWAKNAGALIFVLSDKHTREADGSIKGDSYSHSFDAGAAWAALAAQAVHDGLVTHGMTGLDFEKAPAILGIGDDYRLEAGIAVGHIGKADSLPEGLQAKEQPSERKPLSAIAFHGPWQG
ncbi:nitroreductase family protein [Altericroceibacterium endophyticum]|uniref:Nitroreductase n=1 Tax=Altericroceibacterium endophyticum TaxID=1808508 RepID=A0A6I4T4P7_9SPHN|nr:nitroreductase [Altericroceibacterium endophyticum]